MSLHNIFKTCDKYSLFLERPLGHVIHDGHVIVVVKKLVG